MCLVVAVDVILSLPCLESRCRGTLCGWVAAYLRQALVVLLRWERPRGLDEEGAEPTCWHVWCQRLLFSLVLYKLSLICWQTDSDSDSGDEMKQLQEHHKEWRKEIDFMAERGRQLEEAMENLLRKKQKQKQKRRETMIPTDFSAVGGVAASIVSSPVMCSTQAYGVAAVPVEQSLNAAAVSDSSSVFERFVGVEGRGGHSSRTSGHDPVHVEDNSMWLRPRNSSSGRVTDRLGVDGFVQDCNVVPVRMLMLLGIALFRMLVLVL